MKGKAVKRFVLLIVWLMSAYIPLRAQDGPIVLRATTMLDGRGNVVRNTSIVVEGSSIVRLDPGARGTVYDLSGLTVMPGWIDTHIHSGSGFDIKTGSRGLRDEGRKNLQKPDAGQGHWLATAVIALILGEQARLAALSASATKPSMAFPVKELPCKAARCDRQSRAERLPPLRR
jgi:hypothetical protein